MTGAGDSVLTVTHRHIVDLSHTIDLHIPLWPGVS
jgi:kynurenine formamidase